MSSSSSSSSSSAAAAAGAGAGVGAGAAELEEAAAAFSAQDDTSSMSRSSLNTSPGLARGWRRADVAPLPAVRPPDLLRCAARCRGRCHVTLAPYKTTMSKVGTGTSLAPTLLLSMPQLADPNFTQTVVRARGRRCIWTCTE